MHNIQKLSGKILHMVPVSCQAKRVLYQMCAFASLLCSASSSLPQIKSAKDGPQTIRTIYILPSAHWDLGFIRTPEGEREAIKPHLDAVLAACEADRDFRWTIESIWQLEAWHERTNDPRLLDAMRKCIHDGRIDVSAEWGSMHTEWMSTEVLSRQQDDAQTLAREFGFRTDMAMENDTPGFSIRLPQLLQGSGVRYLITGSNTFIGGGTALSPGHVPFQWRGPDGSHILIWQTQGKEGGYTEGLADYYLDPAARDPYLGPPFYPKEFAGLSAGEITNRGVQKLLKHFQDGGFRGASVGVLYMHDGIGPEYEQRLLPIVQKWNREHDLPKLQVATPHEFFAALEKQGPYPVEQGDWSGLWAAVKTNSPALSADARLTEERLPMAETAAALATLLKGSRYPKEELARAQKFLEQYDEHNGAGNGSWPNVLTESEIRESNQEYCDGVRAAHKNLDDFIEASLSTLLAAGKQGGEETPVLAIFNLRTWARDGMVRFKSRDSIVALEDRATHLQIPVTRVAADEWEFLASDVPSFGYRSYRVHHGAGVSPVMSRDVEGPVATAENERYRVEMNAGSGDINSITDKRTGRNLLQAGTTLEAALNGHASSSTATVHVVLDATGQHLMADRPLSWRPHTTLTLPQGIDAVWIDEEWDRTAMPPNSYGQSADHYTFQFVLNTEKSAQRWVDDGIGFHRFPEQLLPGARADGVIPQWTFALEEREIPRTIMLAQRESFFLQIPAAAASGAFDVLGLTKSDETESKDHGVVRFASYEPGYPNSYSFHFALRTTNSRLDPVEAYRFGREEAVPMVPIVLPHAGSTVPVASFLSCSKPGVVVLAFRPSRTGQRDTYVIRLQEIAGIAERGISLSLPRKAEFARRTDTPDPRTLTAINLQHFSLRPHETATLRVRFAAPLPFDKGL